MSVGENVKARQAAVDLVDMGISLGKEAGLSVEGFRRYWQNVMELSANLIGDKILCDRCGEGTKQTEVTKSFRKELHDDSPFPFGKYRGKRCGDVPDDYLEWCGRQRWIDEWPDVVEYINAM